MAKAYGSITIVDIGDLGQLSVVPESNQPTMVVYDPDSNKYNPDWSVSNSLVLTPIIYYGGKPLTANKINPTVSWSYKKGSNAASDIKEEEGTIDDSGKLTIDKNLLKPTETSLLTFVVTVNYIEPNTKIELTASGQITFGLIQNASSVKTISIVGENVFLYNSSNEPINTEITLTARLGGNAKLKDWVYVKNNEETSLVGEGKVETTLTIEEDDSRFINDDIIVIRAYTATPGLYDEHSIVKIRDGAHGTSTISIVLSNEDQMIPCDSKGIPVENAFSEAQTSIIIYEGNVDDTENWYIKADPHNVIGRFTNENLGVEGLHGYGGQQGGLIYQVNSWETNSKSLTGSVTFTCYNEEKGTFIKKFSLTKITTGANGTSPIIYSLESDSLVTNAILNDNNEITEYKPATISLRAFQWNGVEKEDYKGALKYKIDDDDTKVGEREDALSWNIAVGDLNPSNNIKFYLHVGEVEDGALLDTQTIVVTRNGNKGLQGDAAYNFIFGNQMHVIPCDNSGKVLSETIITIPFSLFKGAQKQPCYVTEISGTVAGQIEISGNISSGNSTADGIINLAFREDTTLGDMDSGEVIFTLSDDEDNPTISKDFVFTWTKNKQAADGSSAVLFQLFAPQGNIINNGENDVVLKASLMDGATSVNLTGKVRWYQYKKQNESGFDYDLIPEEVNGEYIVTADTVDGYGSFKAIVNYKEKDYEAYISVEDRDDPLQITVVSTIGDKITNSIGRGLVYARIFRNGVELDHLPTSNYGITKPSSGSDGDFFYLITPSTDSKNGSVTLQIYDSGWRNATDDDYKSVYQYNWSLRQDYNSEPVTHEDQRVIYVDSYIINNKMIFDVEVTERAEN